MARLPPTIESPRSSFSPAMPARFRSRREATWSTTSPDARLRHHVAVQPRNRIVASAAVDLRHVAQGAARPHQAPPRAEGPDSGLPEKPANVLPEPSHLARGRGIGLRKASLRRSEPRGRLKALVSRRPRKRVTCMLPPPDVEERAVGYGQASRPPPESRSGPPPRQERTRISSPSSRTDPAMKPFAVPRVAHGGRRDRHHPFGPGAPGHGHEVSERVSSRSSASRLESRPCASRSRTSRSEARCWRGSSGGRPRPRDTPRRGRSSSRCRRRRPAPSSPLPPRPWSPRYSSPRRRQKAPERESPGASPRVPRSLLR